MNETAPVHGIAGPRAYGWGVFHERHPALIRRLCDSNPYGPAQRSRLEALVEESRSGAVRPPEPVTAGHAPWLSGGDGLYGRPWSELPFLWAENYFYLRLLECVDHFTPGPWQGVDPFAPMKSAELADPGLESDTAWRDELDGASPEESFHALLLASLYGNRADLGFRLVQETTAGADGAAGTEDTPLLADDSAAVWRHLTGRPPGEVHVVLDNAGRELLADLLLADHLLATGRATGVVLHVKPRPYFVSDAVTSDVRDCLVRLAAFSGAAGKAGGRLLDAAASGRLRLSGHDFFCSPLGFDELPGALRTAFAAGSLCVVKGDLNYRRLVGDRAWPATQPFAASVAGVPGALVALRTLKSEVVVGMRPETVERLDASSPGWRTDGSQALVQARLQG
ncbi:damage-control phosphatase ARMT1 family protein [Streptomyces sp. NPDC051173]|uniref:damage-control phosphatase ARMT1 family protein n=1 Tax=Streptomyces sp. NPDC051173 TaxID=3155164 RepID=UPI003450B831